MIRIKDRYIAVEHIAMIKPDYAYSCLYIWFITDGRPVEIELDNNTELDEVIELILNQKDKK